MEPLTSTPTVEPSQTMPLPEASPVG
jgi:hypothetical protein